VKAVKLLRRGRHLQQVNSVAAPSFVVHCSTPSSTVYVKSIDEEGSFSTAPSLSPGSIPRLEPEFFSSAFFRRFHIQRQSSASRSPTLSLYLSAICIDPIIDPSEFCARFSEFSNGNCNALGIPGQLIAMLLAIWAASFGVNEYGIEELHHGEGCGAIIRNRREATNEMVREMLHLIDIYGILRKPTWDGVRALHPLLPLTQGP
jgi:hypothetical protein